MFFVFCETQWLNKSRLSPPVPNAFHKWHKEPPHMVLGAARHHHTWSCIAFHCFLFWVILLFSQPGFAENTSGTPSWVQLAVLHRSPPTWRSHMKAGEPFSLLASTLPVRHQVSLLIRFMSAYMLTSKLTPGVLRANQVNCAPLARCFQLRLSQNVSRSQIPNQGYEMVWNGKNIRKTHASLAKHPSLTLVQLSAFRWGSTQRMLKHFKAPSIASLGHIRKSPPNSAFPSAPLSPARFFKPEELAIVYEYLVKGDGGLPQEKLYSWLVCIHRLSWWNGVNIWAFKLTSTW